MSYDYETTDDARRRAAAYDAGIDRILADHDGSSSPASAILRDLRELRDDLRRHVNEPAHNQEDADATHQ